MLSNRFCKVSAKFLLILKRELPEVKSGYISLNLK